MKEQLESTEPVELFPSWSWVRGLFGQLPGTLISLNKLLPLCVPYVSYL